MTHEMDQDRQKRISPPPPPPPPRTVDALTDAPQKKKPWTKPTILVIDDGTVDAVLASTDPLHTEFGNDAYRPES